MAQLKTLYLCCISLKSGGSTVPFLASGAGMGQVWRSAVFLASLPDCIITGAEQAGEVGRHAVCGCCGF